MYKIKLTFPYVNWPIFQQTPDRKGKWGDYQFFLNDDIEECDYWIIFGSLLKTTKTKCPPENIILLTSEPSSVSQYKNAFLQKFAYIITCQKEIEHLNKHMYHQGHPWFVNKSYDELKEDPLLEKTKELCIIVSNKQFTAGHKKRYDFAMELKNHYKDQIDIFGRGIKDFDDKYKVLRNYKYSIAIENYSCEDWFTEKLYDCYLSDTHPIYYGCPNINKYFDKNSYTQIDLNNIESSIEIIDKILKDKNHYRNSLPFLREAKLKYLDSYNIFPLVINFIEKYNLSTKKDKQLITLLPEELFYPYDFLWMARTAKRAIYRSLFNK